MDVERTPSCVEMLEDLDGGCVAVGGVYALELRVPVFVEGLSEVCCDSSEETFPYGPCFACAFPFLFHSFPGVCLGGVSDIGIISVGFDFLDPCQICKMVVLVFTYNFGEESIFVSGRAS